MNNDVKPREESSKEVSGQAPPSATPNSLGRVHGEDEAPPDDAKMAEKSNVA